jgi:hypothetical protein
VGVEALRIALVQVEQGVAVGHQLSQRAAAAGRVRDPDRLREPQVARGRTAAQQREAVGRERHEPVEGARQLDVAQSGQQPPGFRAGRGEVLGRERQLGRALGVGEARFVAVVADRVAVGDLTEVHRVILVAQDRVHDLARLARELGQRRRVGELVLDRLERDVEPRRELRRLPAPNAGRNDDVLGADRAKRRLHSGDPAALDDETCHLTAAECLDRGGAAQRLGRPHGLGDAVVGDVKAAEDRRRLDQRDQLGDLRGVEELRVEPVPARARPAAVELGQAFVGRGDLDAADRVVGVVRGQRLDRPLRQARHRARRVVLEDEAGGMRRRATGREQLPSVDHDDVLPASLGEVVGDAGAGDPGANDHRPRAGGYCLGHSAGISP